jgi:D-alanyl-lipoteichoic acid acyltransferase DltB (MBOAT superfamily)
VYFVTLVVWFATGIWHGASWNFIVWGLLNAVVILLSQECRPLYEKFHAHFPGIQKKYAYRIFQVVRTVLLMSSLRMLDCYRNVGLTFKMFGTMFTDWNMTAAMKGLLQLGLTAADYAVVAVAVVLVLCVSLKQRRGSIRERLYERTAAVQYLVVFALLFAILIFGAYGIGYDANQFIYNQF